MLMSFILFSHKGISEQKSSLVAGLVCNTRATRHNTVVQHEAWKSVLGQFHDKKESLKKFPLEFKSKE